MYKSIFERVYTERGREEGLQKGLQEGRQEGRLEMARNLLARGVPPSVIADSSGLSQNEIQALTE